MRKQIVRQMLFFAIVISTLLPLFIFPIISNNYHKLNPCPQLSDGVLNLKDYDFFKGSPLPLNGKWRHFEGEWIVTDKKISRQSPTSATVPTPWLLRANGKQMPEQNIKESYSITLINCPPNVNLTSYIPNMNTSYRIFIDEKIVYNNASLLYHGAPESNIYEQPHSYPALGDGSKSELVIEFLSNRNQNLYFTPMLSESNKEFMTYIKTNAILNGYIGMVILSICCFVAVILLKDKSFPSISLLTLDFIVLLRLLFKNKLLLLYLSRNLNLNYDIFNAFIITISLFLPIVFLFCASQLLKLAINKKHIIAIGIYELLFCPFIFSSVLLGELLFVQILSVISYLPFCYMIWLIYKEVKNDSPYILLVSGILFLLISGIIAANMVSFGLLVLNIPLYSSTCIVLSLILQMIMYFSKNHKAQEEIMELEKLRLKIKENEMAMMLSQIKPHFLYNTLIAIQVLCTEEPDTAAEATLQFANYMRENMHFINIREPIPFQRELNHIKNYMAIEKLRFQDRLTIEMNIQVDNFMLPPLTIQPIIENAIKHGACKNINGGRVLLSTFETPYSYFIKIEDNGPGFDTSILEQKSDSIGIANISFRLKELMNGEITINSKLNNGTTVIVTLPKEANI